MSSQIRREVRPEDGVVVFLTGLRVHRPWKVHRWLPVVTGMSRMLAALSRDPSLGLLGYRMLLDGSGVTVLQYWRDEESLARFARAGDQPHRPAWRAFYGRRGDGGDVGIWHEVLPVVPGQAVGRYLDMAPVGLGDLAPVEPGATPPLGGGRPGATRTAAA